MLKVFFGAVKKRNHPPKLNAGGKVKMIFGVGAIAVVVIFSGVL